MLRVNKKIEYGVLALLHLSQQTEKMSSVREMADFCHIPETLLSKIMQTLKNVGFVSAVYGNHGGYRLSKELSQISLLDLTQALSGPVMVAECLEPGNDSCPVKSGCAIIEPMNVLNQKIVHLFQETSIEALAGRKAVI